MITVDQTLSPLGLQEPIKCLRSTEKEVGLNAQRKVNDNLICADFKGKFFEINLIWNLVHFNGMYHYIPCGMGSPKIRVFRV